jgi:hypothetical protein
MRPLRVSGSMVGMPSRRIAKSPSPPSPALMLQPALCALLGWR